MTLIEGVGNEVVHFAVVLLAAAVGAIAWWSTNARPDRYRIVLAMRHHTLPQPVSLRIRTGAPSRAIIYMNRQTVVARQPIEAVSASRRTESTAIATGEDVVPLQEMDSMVDADMALLDHNRLRFYRRVESPRVVLNALEPPSEEVQTPEVPEAASNVQMREMDSIVRAMEADIGMDIYDTPTENETNTQNTSPIISQVNEDKKDTPTTTVPEEPASEETPVDASNEQDDSKILIKLKYLNDTLKEVEGRLDELLKDFKWRHFSNELSSSRRVRLIYNGRVLIDDGATLRALGLRHRSVVHCLVHPQSGRTEERNTNPASGSAEGATERGERHWDLENILMTLVSVALTVVWFFRCEYSNMFTASASVALFGLTVFYSVAIFGLYLSDTFQFDRRPQPVPNN